MGVISLARAALGWITGAALCLWFATGNVAASPLGELVLVETGTNNDVRAVNFDDTINLAKIGSPINFRVEYSGDQPGSIQLRLSGPVMVDRIENHPPFTLMGDSGGSYQPWSPQPGDYSLVAEAYAEDQAQGAFLGSQTYSFVIIDEDDTQKRKLTVHSGSGSGEYPPGKPVEIEADTPPREQRFLQWLGNVDKLEKPKQSEAEIPMPDYEAFVVAIYRAAKGNGDIAINGSLEPGKELTIELTGPFAKLKSKPVTKDWARFQIRIEAPDGKKSTVTGAFAGDGKKAEEGNIWRANFTPDKPGEWKYAIVFRDIIEIPSGDEKSEKKSRPIKPYDGKSGTFTIKAPAKEPEPAAKEAETPAKGSKEDESAKTDDKKADEEKSKSDSKKPKPEAKQEAESKPEEKPKEKTNPKPDTQSEPEADSAKNEPADTNKQDSAQQDDQDGK
ncbi:MAG: DUF5060 domain-containing protein [Puniceicoccales bacterium]